ncbi:hypothetical protein GY45DRAFT_760070 [Cubamyces sp. BRFM 1775]|nr:hypothetical protein GY45DRAFT_760070 [Cubamyces sp. BRFM 1775]
MTGSTWNEPARYLKIGPYVGNQNRRRAQINPPTPLGPYQGHVYVEACQRRRHHEIYSAVAIPNISYHAGPDSISMDSCPLLLKLCEAILDALLIDLILVPGLDPPSVYIGQHYEDIQAQQDTLCACALVCRAWRPCSQYLLFKHPLFRSGGAIAQANDTIFRDKASRPWSREWAVTAIHFQGDLDSELRREPGKVAHAGSRLQATQLLKNTNFFMRSFPNLRSLFLHAMRWVAHPPLVRLRLAFFTTLTHLAVDGCRFDSIRDMLDLVWFCSSLTHVRIAVCSFRHLRYCDDIDDFTDPDQLCLARERLGACKHLTFLHIEDINDLFPFLDLPGRVFDDAVTTLWLSISSQPRLDPPYSGSMGAFERFLRGSFPNLLEPTSACRSPASTPPAAPHTYALPTRP